MSASSQPPVVVKRCGPIIAADFGRVLLRRMYPGSHDHAKRCVQRLLDLDEEAVHEELSKVLDLFSSRHFRVEETFIQRFREVRGNTRENWEVSDERSCLIGSYFMQEYSIESAALFNPSIILHPDQSDLPPGAVRFILSLRATGEGHVSSVTFRVGVVNSHHRICLDPLELRIVEPRRNQNTQFEKPVFMRKAKEQAKLNFEDHFVAELFQGLKPVFTMDELRWRCSACHKKYPGINADTVCRNLIVLAESEYEVVFPDASSIPQRILFPNAPSQSHGIEDARFVLFTHDDGSVMYYATYTAYDGRIALPQIMETRDFVRFKFTNLSGAIQNKGFALFPRRVGGKYWMLSRQDDESVLIMSSDSLDKWENPEILLKPQFPWESFKMGNCGSPVETPQGWLVLTHGVGPMRRYALGVALLDLNDPKKVIGRLKEPLLEPNEIEREGYVPNVCYTCGYLLHGEELVVPYAMSDSRSSFATVPLSTLWAAMGITPKTPLLTVAKSE